MRSCTSTRHRHPLAFTILYVQHFNNYIYLLFFPQKILPLMKLRRNYRVRTSYTKTIKKDKIRSVENNTTIDALIRKEFFNSSNFRIIIVCYHLSLSPNPLQQQCRRPTPNHD